MTRAKFCAVAALAAAALWIAGCGGGAAAPTTGGGEEGHEHHHHGPHNGHVFVIGDEKYHGEWTLDSGKVTLYILDSKMEKEVPVTGGEVVIETKIGENAPTSYTLTAVSPMDGKASAFAVTDVNLEGALEAMKKSNIVATIKSLQIGADKFENVKIEEDEHEHGHDHEKK